MTEFYRAVRPRQVAVKVRVNRNRFSSRKVWRAVVVKVTEDYDGKITTTDHGNCLDNHRSLRTAMACGEAQAKRLNRTIACTCSEPGDPAGDCPTHSLD